MLKKGKSDKRRGTIVRKNGHVYRDRVCTVCSKDHWHGENMCITCRNEQQKKRRGVIYKKRKEHPWYSKRQKRLAAHAERIEREIKAIISAGLDPATALYHDYSVVLQSRTSSTYHNTLPGGGNETPCTNGKILVQDRNEAIEKKRIG